MHVCLCVHRSINLHGCARDPADELVPACVEIQLVLRASLLRPSVRLRPLSSANMTACLSVCPCTLSLSLFLSLPGWNCPWCKFEKRKERKRESGEKNFYFYSLGEWWCTGEEAIWSLYYFYSLFRILFLILIPSTSSSSCYNCWNGTHSLFSSQSSNLSTSTLISLCAWLLLPRHNSVNRNCPLEAHADWAPMGSGEGLQNCW